VVVHPADLQDRDGARLVLDRRTRRRFPFIERIFADANYQGPKLATALAKTGTWTIEVIALSFSPNAGSSSAPWLGSAAAGVSPKTSSVTHERPLPSSASP
jgi:hypothetical protein